MTPEFWLQRWEENRIGFHQPRISAHIQEFWARLALPAHSTVFVPLCGKTLDLLWLRAQGHGVLGVEVSPVAVSQFFAENGLQASVIEQPPFERWESDGLAVLRGDFFALRPAHLDQVRGVYDRASLIALPPAMRPDYAAHLRAILPPQAQTLLVTLEYPQAEMRGPPFSVDEQELCHLYAGHYEVSMLYAREVLAENARFAARGLSRLSEKVYRLSPRAP